MQWVYGGPSVCVDRQLCSICYIIILSILSASASPSSAVSPALASEQATVASKPLRLSMNDALGLFIRQNLDVLIAKYGIEYTKGQEVTARLFPNPLFRSGHSVPIRKGGPCPIAGNCLPKSLSCSS